MPPSARIQRRTLHWLLRGVLIAAACTDSTSPSMTKSQLAFGAQPRGATAGTAMYPFVTVIVEDYRGDTVLSATDLITLTLAQNVNGAQLVDTARAAAVDGVATFRFLRVRRAGEGYVLNATAGGLNSVSSEPFDITAAPPVALIFTSQPDFTVTSAPLTPVVTVVARDSVDNAATSFSGTVTVALAANPAHATLSGTTAVAAVNGIATFADLSINQPGAGYTLTAAATALPTRESAPFTLVGAIATLQVRTSTGGARLDPDGYTACVDPTPDGHGGTACLYDTALTLATNGMSTLRADTGAHTVLLRGVAVNCIVAGDNPRGVSAPKGVTTDVAFAVTCVQPTLRVTTSTSGTSYNPAGTYSVCIDQDYYYYGCNSYLTIGVNSTVSTILDPGEHFVELDGVPYNCIVTGGISRSVTATGDITLPFFISCLDAGSVRVTTTTSGTDTNPAGYLVCVDREGNACFSTIGVPDAGSATVSGVLVGAHTVSLTGLSANCTVNGGPTRAVTVTANAIAAVSFDVTCVAAERVAYASGGTIYVQRVDGGGGQALTGGSAPAWSPDGMRVAFECDLNICVINSDGSGRAPLTSGQVTDRHPSWSPDGTKIAFASYRAAGNELFIMSANGSGVVQLTNNVGFRGSPAWSPDGLRIAFDCEVDAGNRDICTVNADGSGFTRITTDPASDHGAAWRPDGQAIAFATARYGPDDMTALVSPAGGAVSAIGGGLLGFDPTWSSDGSQLAVTQYYVDYYGQQFPVIVAVRADGTNPRTIANAIEPAWKPHP